MNPNNPELIPSFRNHQGRSRWLAGMASRGGLLAACIMLGVATLAPSARSTPSYGAAVLANNPVAFWPLNETADASAGTVAAVDAGANAFNATYGTTSQNKYNGILGPQPVSDGGLYNGFASGQGALLTTAGDINSPVILPALNLNTNTVTIAMWINPSDVVATYTGLLMNRNGADAAGLGFGGTASGGMAELGYNWNQNSGTTWSYHSGLYPVVGIWQFAALVIQSNSATFYLYYLDPNNGNQPVLKSAVNAIAHNAEAFSGGVTLLGDDVNGSAGDSARVFNGTIAGAAVFNSALTADQILTLFSAGAGVLGYAPQISVQPRSQYVFAGSPAILSAGGVSGSAPLVYQWKLNGTNVNLLPDSANFSGANSNTLTILNMTPADAGSYQLSITNAIGGITSSNAILTIQSASLVGQWFTNGTLTDISGHSPAGTHDAYGVGGTIVYDELSNPVATNYNYMFTNDVPFGKSGRSLYLTTDETGVGNTLFVIRNSSTLDAGYTNTFDERLNNNFTLTFWAKGVPAAWAPWVSKYGEGSAGWQMRAGSESNTPCWTIRDGGAGSYTVGHGPSWSLNGDLDDLHSAISVDDGWHLYTGVYNLNTATRDLYVDGLLVGREIGNMLYGQAAEEHLCIGGRDNSPGNTFGSFYTGLIYDVRVYNYALSQAEIYGVLGAIPPSISSQPKSGSVIVGRTAQLSAAVVGTDPLTYQWRLNGTNISLLPDSSNFTGADSNKLTILSAALADSGSYQLVASNAYGLTVSSNATLTVVPKLLLGKWFTNDTVADVSGHSPAGTHDGTPVGSGIYSFSSDVPPAFAGQSVQLDGTGGFTIANTATTDGETYTNTFDASMFTVTFWAKGRGNWTTWDQWVSKNGDDGFGWMIGTEAWSRNLNFTMRGIDKGGITVTAGAGLWGNEILEVPNDSISDTSWYFYSATYDVTKGVRSLYRNGVLVAQQTGNAQYSLATNQHLCIGCQEKSDGSVLFSATTIYDVRFYNYDMTASEVVAMIPDPVVSAQPLSVNGYVGGKAQFSATTMTMASPVTNHWQFNGINLTDGPFGGAVISGANSTTLTISSITPAVQGQYHLVVSDSAGMTVSSNATLTVLITALPPAANLVGEWVAGATNLSDTSGYTPGGAHNGYGVLTSGAVSANYAFSSIVPPGATGQSLTLSGNTALVISNTSTLDGGYLSTFDDLINTNGMTVTCWAKGLPGTWNPWVSKYGENGAGWQLRVNGSGNTPCWTIRGTGGAEDMASALGAMDGNWHCYAGTYSPLTGVRSLYVDGVLVATQTGQGPLNGSVESHLMIGGRDNGGNSFGNYFAGQIYGVRIYNAALSEAQVNYLTQVPSAVAPVPTFSGSPVIRGHSLILTWSGGTLLGATNVMGPYLPVAGATSPYTNDVTATPMMFYKLSNP